MCSCTSQFQDRWIRTPFNARYDLTSLEPSKMTSTNPHFGSTKMNTMCDSKNDQSRTTTCHSFRDPISSPSQSLQPHHDFSEDCIQPFHRPDQTSRTQDG